MAKQAGDEQQVELDLEDVHALVCRPAHRTQDTAHSTQDTGHSPQDTAHSTQHTARTAHAEAVAGLCMLPFTPARPSPNARPGPAHSLPALALVPRTPIHTKY